MIYHCHCHYCCHVLLNAMQCNAMLYSLLFISVYLLHLFYFLLLTSFYLLFTYFSRERARSRMRVRVRELHASVCICVCVSVYLRICTSQPGRDSDSPFSFSPFSRSRYTPPRRSSRIAKERTYITHRFTPQPTIPRNPPYPTIATTPQFPKSRVPSSESRTKVRTDYRRPTTEGLIKYDDRGV